MGEVLVGPAGWDYKDWWGKVYPKPKPRGFDPLAHLAAYFDVIEVNSCFYRPMDPKVATQWLKRVAANPRFLFTAKLWRRFTHEREAAWTKQELSLVRGGLDVLHGEGKLGALLLQFPWSFKRDDAGREWLSDLVAALSPYPLVVEVRHESWNVPHFFEALAQAGVGFANIDQPLFARSIAPSAKATSKVAYVRVHGRNYKEWWRRDRAPSERYNYLYTAQELLPWAERTRELARQAERTFVVTNNHFEGKAAANAVMLASMVKGGRVDAPAQLRLAYAKELAPFVTRA